MYGIRLNRKIIRLPIIILMMLFLFNPKPVRSQINYGLSARGASLGPGFAAFADEPTGVFYNPAGVGFLKGYQVSAIFNRVSAFGMPQGESPYTGVFGIYKHNNNFGTVALNLYQTGSFASNTLLRTVNNIAFTYAKRFQPNLSGGINLKYIFESNYGKRKAFDLDLGILYRVNEVINASFSTQNLLHSELTPVYGGSSEYLDRIIQTAFSYSIRNPNEPTSFVFALGIKQQEIDDIRATYGLTSLGVEQWFRVKNPLSWALRGSYTLGKDRGEVYRQFGFGFSILLGNGDNFRRFDYTFQEYPYDRNSAATGNHSIAAVFGFGSNAPDIFRVDNNIAPPNEDQLNKEYASLEERGIIRPATPYATRNPDNIKNINEPTSEKQKFERLKLSARIEDLSTDYQKNYMLMFEPYINFTPLYWKIYIQKKRPKPTTLINIEKQAVKIIEGTGKIPSVIVWNGKDNEGRICKGGKYYYSLIISDDSGRLWRSRWQDFKMR